MATRCVGGDMRFCRCLAKLVLCVVVLAAAGCKEILYSDLSETEANEMVAALAAFNIGSTRTRDKDGIYALNVDSSYVADAIVILRAEGYPREKFATLGDVFNSDGIISTPFAQHARFIHAINQELSHALTSVSGVRSAKVLTTIPVPARYDRTLPSATASVTIHYESDFDVQANVSNFKRMVAAAVPNLDYENVTVSLFKARRNVTLVPVAAADVLPETTELGLVPTEPTAMQIFAGVTTAHDVMRLLSLLAFLAAALIAINLFVKRRHSRRSKNA